MARKTYYKPYRRNYGPKVHWASNLKQGTMTQTSGVTLVENSTQTSTPTPVIVKAGNFKVQGDVTVTTISPSGPGPISCFVFLIYAPEGITSGGSTLSDALSAHPEWVIGWACVDTPLVGAQISAGNKFSISSRLKRNLNSGDKIYLFCQTNGIDVRIDYTAQYFTRAN